MSGQPKDAKHSASRSPNPASHSTSLPAPPPHQPPARKGRPKAAAVSIDRRLSDPAGARASDCVAEAGRDCDHPCACIQAGRHGSGQCFLRIIQKAREDRRRQQVEGHVHAKAELACSHVQESRRHCSQRQERNLKVHGKKQQASRQQKCDRIGRAHATITGSVRRP